MTKLELQTKYLLSKLSNGVTEQDKEQELSAALKSFASDIANLITGLKEKQVDVEVTKDLLEDYGIQYNGKTKKFS